MNRELSNTLNYIKGLAVILLIFKVIVNLNKHIFIYVLGSKVIFGR